MDASNVSNSKAKGGHARAKALSADERSEIAKKAADSRWKTPEATHMGDIRLGDFVLPCAVLADGRRVISQRGVGVAFGRSHGGKNWKRSEDGGGIPNFLGAANLKPFVISDNALGALSAPIVYRTGRSGANAYGIEASLLPKLCDVWLRARDAGVLKSAQQPVAVKADILMRALAHVGIIALVDEATGYQEVRDRKALQEILSKFIGKELANWAKRFPDGFYEQMFRLKSWKYDPSSTKRPWQMANLTVDLVYDRIGPGLTDELKRKKHEKLTSSGKKHALHQWLTEDVGHPALQHHLSGLIFLGKAFPDGDWDGFYHAVNRVAPKQQMYLPFPEDQPISRNELSPPSLQSTSA